MAGQMFERIMLLKEPVQQVDDILTGDEASNQQCQALAAELVQH
jgi:hypothetical protein